MKKKKVDHRTLPRKRNPVGKPTALTEELSLSIKALVLEGLMYKTIREKLDISKGNWDLWVNTNYKAFRDMLTTYDHEYQLKLAKENIRQILNMKTVEPAIGIFGPIIDKKTKKPVMKDNDKLIKIKSDMSVFVAETLGRKNYTKRTEIDDVTEKKIILLD